MDQGWMDGWMNYRNGITKIIKFDIKCYKCVG